MEWWSVEGHHSNTPARHGTVTATGPDKLDFHSFGGGRKSGAVTDSEQTQRLVGALADKLGAAFTAQTARGVLELHFEEPSVERRQRLAQKANEGLLTKEELAEHETYLHLRTLLSLLQSRARLFLREHGLGA